MAIIKNVLITLFIAILILAWNDLQQTGKKQAYELNDDIKSNGMQIALVISRTGQGKDIGIDVEYGVRHYLAGQYLEEGQEVISLKTYDDKGDPKEAVRIALEIAQNPRIVAVLGHTGSETTLAAAKIYQDAGIPMLSPSADASEITVQNDWAFSTIMPDTQQGKFTAYYIMNALGGKNNIMIVTQDSMNSNRIKQIQATAEAEGVNVINTVMKADADGYIGPDQNDAVVAEIKRIQPDIVYLALEADYIQEMLRTLKDSQYTGRVMADGHVGTPHFARRFDQERMELNSRGFYTNDVVVPVPFILDIANNEAQTENFFYHNSFGYDMSWPFAYGYDAAKVLTGAIKRAKAIWILNDDSIESRRKLVRDAFWGMDYAENGIEGITGVNYFSEDGGGQRPPVFGSFRARALTSDLNQYISSDIPLEHYDPAKHTRNIVVDDLVYGLSDVVYTGVKFRLMEQINRSERSAYVDFDVWFRYRGDFDPADIVFDSVDEETHKIEVVEEHSTGTIKYKRVRVKGKFFFQTSPTEFMQNKIDLLLSFKHKSRNRNELIYIVDRSAYDTSAANVSLIQQMIDDKVLLDSEEAFLDDAVLFEDIWIVRAFGDPVFVDGQLPFSHFNTRIKLHQSGLSPSRQIGKILDLKIKYMIFFVSTLIFLVASYTFIIPILGQKLLLIRYFALAGAMLGLEFLFFTEEVNLFSADIATLGLIIKLIDSIWLLFFAYLAHVLVSNYGWLHIERSTGHPVPAIARTLMTVIIFIIASTMIYANVFDQSIVSIVAASSALTVVIGFSLREMILDFFSGIILNIERPFHIGDFCQFHLGRGQTVEGGIEEMNWRTVRVRDRTGALLVLPNSKISVQHLTNMSLANKIQWRIPVYLDPSYDPNKVLECLKNAVAENPYITGYNDEDLAPRVTYRGCENVAGMWVARYVIKFNIEHMGKRNKASELVWKNVWQELSNAHISFDPSMNSDCEYKKQTTEVLPIVPT